MHDNNLVQSKNMFELRFCKICMKQILILIGRGVGFMALVKKIKRISRNS